MENAKSLHLSTEIREMPLSELCDYLETKHHAYAHREIPRLIPLTERVAMVHGQDDPGLLEIRDLFAEMARIFSTHLLKEERILFPMIRSLEIDGETVGAGCGDIGGPIRQMQFEHDEVDGKLQQIKELSNSFKVPEHSCSTYRAMLYGLQAFLADYVQHSAIEDNVLFPRVLEKASQMRK